MTRLMRREDDKQLDAVPSCKFSARMLTKLKRKFAIAQPNPGNDCPSQGCTSVERSFSNWTTTSKWRLTNEQSTLARRQHNTDMSSIPQCHQRLTHAPTAISRHRCAYHGRSALSHFHTRHCIAQNPSKSFTPTRNARWEEALACRTRGHVMKTVYIRTKQIKQGKSNTWYT